MKIELVPDTRSQFPQWIKLAQVLREEDVIDTLTFKARALGQMSFDDANDALVGLCAWRDVTNYPSLSEGQGQATMFDLVEIAEKLGLKASYATVASIGANLENIDYIMHDDAPIEVTGDVYFAYLNRAGFERGLSVLGRMYEERVYSAGSLAPTAFGTVGLDHNQSQVAEAVRTTHDAIEAIRSSNTLDSEQKSLWLSHLETGLSLLTKPRIYFSAVSLLLIQPLYSAYSSVIEDSAKPAIEAALQALKIIVGF